MKKVAKFGILALLLVSLVTGAFALGNEDVREALEAGDYANWKEAKTAGLTEERFNQMKERHEQMSERREEMEQAMEQGYEVWKEAVADSPKGNHMTEVITEENFDTFVEMHEAKQSGDFETAKELAQEIGLNGLGRRHGKCPLRAKKSLEGS
jgi:hypothetical protein